MDISHKKLRKSLIDMDIKKKAPEKAAGISNYVIFKMAGNENITVETVGEICKALNCGILNVIELEHDEEAEISN